MGKAAFDAPTKQWWQCFVMLNKRSGVLATLLTNVRAGVGGLRAENYTLVEKQLSVTIHTEHNDTDLTFYFPFFLNLLL